MPGVGNLQKVVVYFSPTEALGGFFFIAASVNFELNYT